MPYTKLNRLLRMLHWTKLSIFRGVHGFRWAKGEAAPTNREAGRGISVNSHFDSGNIEVFPCPQPLCQLLSVA